MELRQLEYMVTVAEEMHFGRAAERLHIVQSAVSQQVRRLERELGVELFDRSPRHVRLTPAGERFLPAARAVLVAADRARAVATSLAATDVPLRIGTSSGLGERLETVLDEVHRRSPGTRVELVSLPAAQRVSGVASGRLDAAFVRGPEPVPGVTFEPVWTDELVAALPARHPLAGVDRVPLRDLAPLPLRITARRDNPTLVDLLMNACQRAGFTPEGGGPPGPLTDTLAAIGTGNPMWTVVYAAHAEQLRAGRVAFRPLVPPLRIATMLAVPDSPPSARVRALLAACAALSPDEPAAGAVLSPDESAGCAALSPDESAGCAGLPPDTSAGGDHDR